MVATAFDEGVAEFFEEIFKPASDAMPPALEPPGIPEGLLAIVLVKKKN